MVAVIGDGRCICSFSIALFLYLSSSYFYCKINRRKAFKLFSFAYSSSHILYNRIPEIYTFILDLLLIELFSQLAYYVLKRFAYTYYNTHTYARVHIHLQVPTYADGYTWRKSAKFMATFIVSSSFFFCFVAVLRCVSSFVSFYCGHVANSLGRLRRSSDTRSNHGKGIYDLYLLLTSFYAVTSILLLRRGRNIFTSRARASLSISHWRNRQWLARII